tara:strand:- start:207 stop:476 length:270 start_codon:yes stop_codon:yes gene_type:complete
MKKLALYKTIELANLALDITRESLWINMLFPNQWEIVILDQDGKATNFKYKRSLNNKEILLWINEWVSNYEIMKHWRNKKQFPQFICNT